MTRLRDLFHPGSYVPPGTYKRLMRGGTIVMSTTPMELAAHQAIIRHATGRVLITGLGLGMVLTALLTKPEVTEVWVVEQSEEVIALVAPTFADDLRVHLIQADAFTYQPPDGMQFDACWHDVWDCVCRDNLTEIDTLYAKYATCTRWQGALAESLLRGADDETIAAPSSGGIA